MLATWRGNCPGDIAMVCDCATSGVLGRRAVRSTARTPPMRRLRRLAALFPLGLIILTGCTGSSLVGRELDPVVLQGSNVPSLNGIAPNLLVAFRYTDGWVQIPVQVDERA